MNPTILPRDQVAQRLAVSSRMLRAYERRGLVRPVREGELEGYPPSEIRRLWTVVTLHRDAGINLAGIEAILRLREQMDSLCRRLHALAEAIDAELAADPPPDEDQ
ncbi:MerR family transcriptional regulator [Tautonia sociabilis]|nr:MerR family transcriptional regulator [Tautonia sociabilis]